MTATAIIREINKLPLSEKLLLVEQTINAIKREQQQELLQAVDLLYTDYTNDKELTAFTVLDTESFYETK